VNLKKKIKNKITKKSKLIYTARRYVASKSEAHRVFTIISGNLKMLLVRGSPKIWDPT